MKKLYFALILATFLSLSFPALLASRFNTASAEILSGMSIQGYGVRNLTKNESTYSQTVQAIVGDNLEFSINILNTSGTLASGVVLYVYLPTGFPVTNTISVDGAYSGGNIVQGLFLGNMPAGSQKNIVFQTKLNSSYPGYAAIQALVDGDNFNTDSKYVAVTSNGSNTGTNINNPNQSYYYPTPTPYYSNQNSFLSLSVMGRNVSKGETSWQKNIKANPGDLVEFSIMLSDNTYTPARNIRVKETLDQYLDFVSGSVTINNSSTSNALVADQLWIGDLVYQETKYIKFQARVQNTSPLANGQITLNTNTQVWADNNPQISDNASISVGTNKPANQTIATAAAVSHKKISGGKKVALTVPKTTAKNSDKNFLFGTIAFGSFWLLIFLILITLIIFLAIALVQEKKKNKEKQAVA